jgi:two-component system NtrC family sensor kinase
MTEDGANLLLVDDERDFLESLARRLSLRNFTVHTAESGTAALELLDREPIDVAILDVRMPGMDGVATLKELKRRHPEVEVLMLTGHADLDGPLRGLQSGFYDYLTKPVDIERLISKIQSALDRAQGRAMAPGRTFSQKMKERMATADRLAVLGTLAASVVHELNNPLAVINDSTGYMQTVVAKADLPADTREKLEMALDKSATALDRARNISRRLLSFARGADSQAKLLDLREMVSEVIELTQKPAQNMKVEVKARAESGPFTVRLDPYKLRQVLLNLVVNAIQAQESGGMVEITVSGDENEAVISVRDFGPGIPPENMERIFEPFFTTKPEEIGTGLGLPVTRGIVEELRGRLEVECKEGEGALFKVVLPREQIPVSGDAAREKAV